MKVRSVLAASGFVLAMLGAAVSVPESEAATTRCGTEIYYYSDATYTNLVGMRGWLPEHCNCMSYGWGTFSGYRTFEDSYC